MEQILEIKLHSDLNTWLDKYLLDTTKEELITTLLTAHMVEGGGPVPTHHQVTSQEFLTCASIALDDHLPVDEVVKGRDAIFGKGIMKFLD